MSSPARILKHPKVTTKSMKKMGLTMFPQISKLEDYEVLVFSGNPITSFAGLCDSTALRCLYLDETKIKSFDAVPDLPNLEFISLKNSPLGRYKKLMLMACIVFENIQSVNSLEITARMHAQAAQMRETVGPYLKQGWVIISLKPVKLMHTVTRARMTLVLPPPPRAVHENQEEWANTANPEDPLYPEQHLEEPQPEKVDDSAWDELAAAKMNELNEEQMRGVNARAVKNPRDNELRNKRKKIELENTGMRSMLRKQGGPSDPFTHKKSVAPDVEQFRPKPDFSDLQHVK